MNKFKDVKGKKTLEILKDYLQENLKDLKLAFRLSQLEMPGHACREFMENDGKIPHGQYLALKPFHEYEEKLENEISAVCEKIKELENGA